MSNLTTADLRYRINYLNGEQLDVTILVADRAAAEAIARKYNYGDSPELKMYAAAFNAARRLGKPETWEDFALAVLDVTLVDSQGRHVKATNGTLTVADEVVDEDPTR